MKLLSALAVISTAAAATVTATDATSFHRKLANLGFGVSKNTQIFFPSDKNWTNETTQRYTINDKPTYVASVKPASETDLQNIVRFCSLLNIPFLATGGGHGFATTFGQLQHGLEIDLGFFRNVSIDAASNTMTIGGGTLFSDVFDPVFAAGKEVQTGSCPCIGMLGATLGGGIGRMSGYHGMIIDSLLSVRVVTAAGKIVVASEKSNPDLFWGIRGAGMNYGIVVSATYRIPDLTSAVVTNVDIDFPLNQSRVLMEFLKARETTMPIGLSPTLLIRYAAERKEAIFTLNAPYYGSKEEAAVLLDPLLQMAGNLRSNFTEMPWNKLPYAPFWGALAGGCPKGLNANLYGLAVKTLDVDTYVDFFDNWNKFVNANTATQGSVFYIEAFPTQGVRAVADDATAYPHRDANAHLLFNFEYPENEASLKQATDEFAEEWRGRLAAASGYGELRVYVSYGRGNEAREALYGSEQLPRLRSLKKHWDPQNLFRFDQPLD